MKDLLRACHLKSGISEKAGLLEVRLKNKLESEWSQITGGCHYILEYTRVSLQRALNARKKKFRLHFMGSWEPLENCRMKLMF